MGNIPNEMQPEVSSFHYSLSILNTRRYLIFRTLKSSFPPLFYPFPFTSQFQHHKIMARNPKSRDEMPRNGNSVGVGLGKGSFAKPDDDDDDYDGRHSQSNINLGYMAVPDETVGGAGVENHNNNKKSMFHFTSRILFLCGAFAFIDFSFRVSFLLPHFTTNRERCCHSMQSLSTKIDNNSDD